MSVFVPPLRISRQCNRPYDFGKALFLPSPFARDRHGVMAIGAHVGDRAFFAAATIAAAMAAESDTGVV
jgi:hypothetical protein